ncbi:hypothetical protein M514_00548 [Trichuris suis]|uniref:Uncharacterized protein n=1 Tax=Trichuris suis TaxID=68888 RepID=A0A085NDC3_9BILA|nr:hypothetical protein M514_00548 [Trichuris suis]
MANAIKASVVVEHASQCSLDPRPKIICRESFFHLRRIKEALYIKSNSTINRDNGVAVSEVRGLVEVIKPKVGRQVETPNGRNVDGQETESQKTEQSKRRRVELAKLEIPKVMLPNEWSKYRQSYYRMVETSNGQNTESQNVNSEPRRDKRLLDQ